MKCPLLTLSATLFLITSHAAGKQAPATPSITEVTLSDFKLAGNLGSNHASFILTATAQVENPKGASLELLSGPVALTGIGPHPKWNIRAESNRFVAIFERSGKFPVQLKFDAVVCKSNDW